MRGHEFLSVPTGGGRIANQWDANHAATLSDLELLRYRSNLLGSDRRITNYGGGNTSAKLPATELIPPTHVIGRRTEEAIRAGVLLGTADAVDGIVRRIKSEWPNKATPQVIATGGLASLMAPLAREIESVNPDLTLTGLRIAASALGLKW